MGTSKLIDVLATSTWAGGFKTVSCSRQGCSRWLTQRHLSSRRVGVNLRGSWYCSYRCVASATEQRFSELLVGSNHITKHTSRMPLGLTLVSRGWLSGEQFREANEEQKRTGGEIADILMRFGYVDEKQLTTVRAAQWNCPVYTVSPRTSATAIQIPATLMGLYSMIPLHHAPATNKLLVGFVQAIEYGPLYAIEQMTECKTQPCFVTPTDYWAQMEAQRADVAPEELILDTIQSTSEMTRVLCNYGAQLDADEVVIVRCREYLWTRLKGGSKLADLLFKAV